jgi:hypothetical protein
MLWRTGEGEHFFQQLEQKDSNQAKKMVSDDSDDEC